MIFQAPPIGEEERAAITRIHQVRRQLRFVLAEPRRWSGSVRRVLAARAIQGSNSIEGYHVSVDDAVAAIEGEDPAEASAEDWQAITGYRRALTYVLQLAEDPHFSYSADLIRSLHFMMTEHALDAGPGLWRPRAIWVRNSHTGDVVYEGPDAERVPGLIAELVDALGADDGDHPPLVRAAMAHLNLAMIHPFLDGNGRMARCLQTLVLAREGVIAPQLSSIEEYLGEHTQAYYEVLERTGCGEWSPGNDTRPWIRFCLTAHFIQATSVLRRVSESERVWADLEGLVGTHRLQERSAVALFDATLGLRVRNATYRAGVGSSFEEISHAVATADLAAMVRAGLLDQQGKKRGTFYVASGPLIDIRSRRLAGRQPIDTSDLFEPSTAGPVPVELPFG